MWPEVLSEALGEGQHEANTVRIGSIQTYRKAGVVRSGSILVKRSLLFMSLNINNVKVISTALAIDN